MKHCILAKFTPEAKAQRAALLPRIREIFSAAADIPGVHGAEVIPNCVDRDNRYDVLIRLDMDREALSLYDVSAMHTGGRTSLRPCWRRRPSLIMNHNHQFTGGYGFLLAGEPPYRQLVCCMVSVLSSALAHTILYSPWVIYFLCIALDKSFEELFYFWEAAMDNVLLLIFGIFLSVLGILNIKGNISTIHSYNRRKVKEEDIPKYGKAVGTGTVIMGASLILAYFATFWNEAAIDYIIFPAITIGLAFILYGQIKYNHGIF